ncbi:MAG: M36 family metallopeptidase [Bacteroidetes bacterium]|nr:M36 family metallopeptidase [Bacteroidota bacterium]
MIKVFSFKCMLAFTMAMLFFLTISAQNKIAIVDAQLATDRGKNGWAKSDIENYIVSDDYTDSQTGLRYIYTQQSHKGIPLYNAISVFVAKNNTLLYSQPTIVGDLASKVNADLPAVTPEAAIGYALINIGSKNFATVKLINIDSLNNTYTYISPAISASPIKVKLVYRMMDSGVFLAWDVSIELINEPHYWDVRVDALTGDFLDKNDWTVSCNFDDPNHHQHNNTESICNDNINTLPAPLPLPAPPPPLGEYNVYPFPIEAPSFGGRTNLINPEDLTASPFGWHDDNGVTGNEYTITRGNNVHAYEDANNDNLPGYSPNSATLQFNYPVDLTQAPLVNQDASITNLFYLNNRIHDVLHYAGFTAPAGNFQQNNYGNGGLGNDYVQAEAFDGGGTNNANFGTPADGSRPRMQMYLWTAPNPDRDGSFDNGIVAHEYGHGVSNRLTGGPSQAGCLQNAEQGGEGWSDWLALIMTIEPGDTVAGGMLTQARGIGTYALNQATTGQGIRRFRYSVNMAINPQTYADLATSGTGPHNKGEIWCDAIWDMTCFLVNDLGFNSDPSVATAGNNIAMRLVLEGMKLQPCSPGYLDARDAILTADALLYGNAHRCRIWEAFARRGMGFSAIQGSSSSSTDQTAAFNLPPFCLIATQPPVAAFTSNLSTIPCAGTVQFTDASTQAFNWAWDFGDGGTSILTNPSHQYTSPGTYNVKLVVTNPLGSDSVVHPITVSPAFSATVTASPNPVACGSPVQLNAVGSGSSNFTYNLASIPFAPVTGTPIAGPAGDDIVSSFIPIGFNFPFYNSAQTQLKISTNGFISFNSNSGSGCCAGGFLPNNSSTLSNLIAVCWTDLFVGAPNSIDYFNLTSPNRFVIRWNAVAHCCATTPAQVTVQIILYETGEIEMHNTSILTSTDVMTMGIENANGTVATVVPGRNASNFAASNEAWKFTPAINYTYNWQPGNLNGASQTVTPVANTTYTVNVADGSGCVQPFTTPLITVTPVTVAIGGSVTFCSGGATTLDAGSYATYNWSTGATTQTITVNTAGTYTVSVTNAGGCSGSGSITTSISTSLTPVILGDLSICSGNTNVLDAGVGYATYSWSTGATTQTIPVSTTGTFTVTVSDGAGCSGTASATTTIDAIPSPIISGNLSFCPGTSSVLSVGLFAGYNWSTGGTTQSISVNTAGTFTVTVTNVEGCTSSASVTTSNYTPPTPVITGATGFCTGSSTILDAGVYTSYAWSTGATTQTITVNSALIFTVTVTDGNGCTASTSATTTLFALPNPVITGAATICNGSTNILDAGTFASYNWSTGSTLQTTSITLPGTYTVTVTDANGCTNSATKTVVSLLAITPAITLSPNTPVCPGSSVTLTLDSTITFSQTNPITIPNTLVNATPYPAPLVVSGFPVSGVTVKSVKLNGVSHTFPDDLDILLQSPTGTNVILMSDVGGGTDIVSQNFTFKDGFPALSNNGPITGGTYAPTNVGSPDTWSAPGPGAFTQAAPALSMFNGDMNGTWNLLVADGFAQDGGTINSWSITFESSNTNITYAWSPATGLSNTTQLITTATPATTTTYTVTINDGISGCTTSLSATVNVHVAPAPSISGALTFCSGSSTTLDAGVFASYLWSTSETTQTISVNTAGTFTVTVTDGNGCAGSASVTTTVNANPTPSISGTTTFCAGSSTTLDAGAGYAGYSWSTGSTIQTIAVNTAGTFTVTVTDGNGCTGSASATTTVNSNPTPAISGSLIFCAGGSTTLDAGSFSGYSWSSGETTQTISVNTAGTFTVTVTDGNGCTGSASATTTVNSNPTPVISGSLIFCAGSSTTLDAGSFSGYSWSTGASTQTISVNSAGTFTVTVTDLSTGCTASSSATVNSNTNNLTCAATDNISCTTPNGTVTATAAGVSFMWDNGNTNASQGGLVAGTYTVTVTDLTTGCTATCSATVNGITSNPTVTCAATDNTLCIGANGTVSAASSGVTYLWSNGSTSYHSRNRTVTDHNRR